MWSKIIFVISFVFTTVIANNVLINLDDRIEYLPNFDRHHGYALIGHVIKTLSLFIADCLEACHETLACFSFNYRDFKNGTFVCELNRSNKKQSFGSFVRKEGYEYAEAKVNEKKYCEKDECHVKDALPGDWFKLNTSLYKIISEKKNWSAARQHCQSLDAELASFTNELQNRFVMAVSDLPIWLAAYKMDTVDTGLSMINGAKVVDIDGTKAVYFDGANDYATIPRFDIRTTDWTIAVWFKADGVMNAVASILNDVGSQKQFNIFFYYASLTVNAFNSAVKKVLAIGVPKSEFPLNQWIHLAVTWNRTARQTEVFFDAILKASRVSTEQDIDLHETPETTFEVGANDEGRISQLKGWLKELIVSKKAFTKDEIQALKDDGFPNEAWTGLNDITTEDAFQWSDGTPLTYTQSSTSSSNTPLNDCVAISRLEENVFTWRTLHCGKNKVFICKKN